MVAFALCVSAAVVWQRDAGFGGPHHDEVIALLAAKGLERTFADITGNQSYPFHEVVKASEWQHFTHSFPAEKFSEIRKDVLTWDKHPPLSFWVMNRWLSLFDNGSYQHALVLTWLQVMVAAGLLSYAVFRATGSASWAVTAFGIFLVGNSTIFIATWVRQYSLYLVCFAGLLLVSGELVRRHILRSVFVCLTALLALICLCGMMTQYSFISMSAPVHLSLLLMLAGGKRWRELLILIAAYIGAALLFFLLMPGVLDQVAAVSSGLERKSQWADALGGIPPMYIPLPSILPSWLVMLMGTAGLFLPFALAGWLGLKAETEQHGGWGKSQIVLLLAGMLGAGLLQFLLVGLGYFPGWATGPNHMGAFWLLTVFAAVLVIRKWSLPVRSFVIPALLLALFGVQCLYIWNLHRILPSVNKSYIDSLAPDLVITDNTARGFVLEIAEKLEPDHFILVTDSDQLTQRFATGQLDDFSRILYLPMDYSVREGKDQVLQTARSAGWIASELTVVHPGLYEAVLLEHSD